jgi:hypothetical protein
MASRASPTWSRLRAGTAACVVLLLQIDLGQIVLVHQLDESRTFFTSKDVAQSGTRVRTHQFIPAGNSIRE